jgi:hypothetical protein
MLPVITEHVRRAIPSSSRYLPVLLKRGSYPRSPLQQTVAYDRLAMIDWLVFFILLLSEHQDGTDAVVKE